MVAPVAAGLIGGAAASAASAGIAGLMSPDKKLSQSQLGQLRGGIQAGGLRSGLGDSNRRVDIHVDPARTALVNALGNVFRTRSGQLSQLRTEITAGRGALTEARLRQIDAGERQALGDLRTNLGRRRILGSSFSQDAEAAIRDRFATTRAEQEALGILETLGINVDLLEMEAASSAAEFTTKLDELGFQAQVAQNILTSSNASVGALSSTTAQIAALFKQEVLGAGSDALGQLGKLPEALAKK